MDERSPDKRAARRAPAAAAKRDTESTSAERDLEPTSPDPDPAPARPANAPAPAPAESPLARGAGLVLARPYHLAITAFATGLALAEAAPAVVVAAGAGVVAALALSRALALGVLVAALLLGGASLGDLRLRAIDRPGTLVQDGQRVRLRAHLLTAPRPGPFGSSAEVVVAGGRLRGARLLVRVPRWAPLPHEAEPGAELVLEGRTQALQADRAKTPDDSGSDASFDFDAYLRRRGIAAELLLERAHDTGARRGGLPGLLDRMRSRAERAVGAGMPAERAALLRGMVLGQDERIGAGTRDDFRASGLAHILAVSGQNVMLLCALALPFLLVAGVGLRTRLAVLAVLIALYVPVAGAGPSLQRAGVMGLAGLAAMAASRPASRWYALLLAAAVTLVLNPRAWADPGWQLSFAAVAGILLIGVPLGRTLKRAAEELLGGRSPAQPRAAALAVAGVAADGLAITLAATLATAPLLGHHFGSVPLAGLPANLLALPAVAPAMWVGMLKAALGQLGGVEAAHECAGALGRLASLPVGYVAVLAERFAQVPAGQLSVPLRSPLAVATAYTVLALAAVELRRAARPLAPRALEAAARWRRLPPGGKALLAAALAMPVVVAAGVTLRAPESPNRLTVRFLDVGQGDATLVQHPDGTAVLFDGGPPEAGVARLLRRAGVKRLALVVATHASRDHHGGLAEVLRSFPVDAVLDGGDGSRDTEFRSLLRQARAEGVRRIAATAPLALALGSGDLRVRVLSPDPRPPGPAPEDPNPRAVIAHVSAGHFDLLLSADAESEPLLGLELPDVEAMKVPHHGSSDPGLAEMLERTRPEVAAIEVGPNTYGHPAPSTLAALRRANVTTYRTDRDGTVTLSVDGSAMRVETER